MSKSCIWPQIILTSNLCSIIVSYGNQNHYGLVKNGSKFFQYSWFFPILLGVEGAAQDEEEEYEVNEMMKMMKMMEMIRMMEMMMVKKR